MWHLDSGLSKTISSVSWTQKSLVHEYDEIDPTKVFMAIDFALRQYPVYVLQINTYLSSLDVGNG